MEGYKIRIEWQELATSFLRYNDFLRFVNDVHASNSILHECVKVKMKDEFPENKDLLNEYVIYIGDEKDLLYLKLKYKFHWNI